MLYKEYITIRKMVLHKIGSYSCQEGVSFSNETLILDNALQELLKTFFLTPFKSEEYYNFTHSSELDLNEIFRFVSIIFENGETFLDISRKMATYLYECSSHPNIKRGELYIVYFENCILDGETTDAIGIFKSENKDKFIKIYDTATGFGIEENEGISINRIDKGCLIFNIQKKDGYVISVVDNTNKSRGSEAKYWTESFLHIKPRQDSFHQTKQIISICRDFSESPFVHEGKLEKISFLSKVFESLSKNCSSIDELAEKIFEDKDSRSEFSEFIKSHANSENIDITGKISMNKDIVNRETKKKSTIKLDNSFEIRIFGSTDGNIIKGFNALRQQYYYTLFFNNEI